MFWVIEIVENLCLFEMNMPPTFFDIMLHLLVHLPKEVDVACPIQSRWYNPSYFLERYRKDLTKHGLWESPPQRVDGRGWHGNKIFIFLWGNVNLNQHEWKAYLKQRHVSQPRVAVLSKSFVRKKLVHEVYMEVIFVCFYIMTF